MNLFGCFLTEEELYYFPVLFCVQSPFKKTGGGSLSDKAKIENIYVRLLQSLLLIYSYICIYMNNSNALD